MNLGLWIVQVVLGAVFVMAGVMKTTQPLDKLETRMKYVRRFPPWVTRFIGVSESSAASGSSCPGRPASCPR